MQPGDSLPTRSIPISTADMVAYAGATWDHHKLHHDIDYVKSKGLDSPVVDGQVFGAYMASQAMDAVGPDYWIESLEFRFRSMVFAGETVIVAGVVESVDGESVSVEHTVTVGERLCVTGRSTVRRRDGH